MQEISFDAVDLTPSKSRWPGRPCYTGSAGRLRLSLEPTSTGLRIEAKIERCALTLAVATEDPKEAIQALKDHLVLLATEFLIAARGCADEHGSHGNEDSNA